MKQNKSKTVSLSWDRLGPRKAMIEVIRDCNLRCVGCPVGNGNASEFPMMSNKMYQEIINKISSSVKKLSLFNYGEPLLHPDIAYFVSYAKRAGIPYVSIHSNGHYLDSEVSRKLIKASLDEIVISLDGVDQESYSKYRLGGNFEMVLNNIVRFLSLQRSLRIEKPIIYIQYIVMSHNENYLLKFIEICKLSGITNIKIKTFNCNMDLKGDSSLTKLIPSNMILSRYFDNSGKSIRSQDNKTECRWPISVITVNSNGTIIPCCYDYNNSTPLGSFVDSSDVWWANDLRRRFIKLLQESPDNLSLCVNCQKGLCNIHVSDVLKHKQFLEKDIKLLN